MSKRYRVLELECEAHPSLDGVLITMTSSEDDKEISVGISGRHRSFTMNENDIDALKKFLEPNTVSKVVNEVKVYAAERPE